MTRRSEDEAIDRARRALARSPDAPEPLFALAALLLGRGDPAANALLPRLDAFRGYGAGWRGLAAALLERGQPDGAIVAYGRALAADPKDAAAWYGLGLAQDEAGQPSADAYRAALAADPGLHEAAFNLGAACQQAGDLDGALAAYGQALRARPEALGRIAHALSSARTGCLFLDPAALPRALGAEALAIDAGT